MAVPAAPAASGHVSRQPEDTRTCGFCQSRQPLSALAQVEGTFSLECLDQAACSQRAARSDLYAQAEYESESSIAAAQALAAFGNAAGVLA